MTNQARPAAYILTGPTASGKTGFSIALAKEFGCEIIAMDSMQLYRGMDIGTAKPDEAERAGIPHHMLDVADPGESFSVARYTELAEAAAADILRRGRRPLFVGGTGFYLRALRHPMAMGGTRGDPALRERLEAEAEAGGAEALHRRLAAVDPATAARLHPNDVRRVVRALEVFELTGRPFSDQPQEERPPAFDYRVAALDMDRAQLYERINRRVDQMIAGGLEAEIRRLLAAGVSRDSQAMKAIGYKELLPCIDGRCTPEEVAEELKKNTRHYAKRQLTWLRAEEDVLWVDALAPDALQRLRAWMNEM